MHMSKNDLSGWELITAVIKHTDCGKSRPLLSIPVNPLVPALVIILLYFFAAIVLHPFADLPFHDDWTYAWSVEHLLNTGELRVLDWSIHYPVVQILWGALFCLPYGFSFSALRFSTLMLALLGTLALYGTLREFGRTRMESLIAILVLVANPVFFVLTFSFMTDVPFVSLSNIAFFFYCARDSSKISYGPVEGLRFWRLRLLDQADCHCHTRKSARLPALFEVPSFLEIYFTPARCIPIYRSHAFRDWSHFRLHDPVCGQDMGARSLA